MAMRRSSPGLNRALPVPELRSLWFYIQQVAFHKHQAERTARDLERSEAERDELARSAAFYRRQVRLESGMGLMLAGAA